MARPSLRGKPPKHPDRLLSSEEVAQHLGISGRCVLNWFYEKIIPAAVHQGKVIRFNMDDVMAALSEARMNRERDEGLAFPEHVVRLALWLLAPEIAGMPAWLLTREPTEDEERRASHLARAYYEGFHGLQTAEEKSSFISGVLAACHLAGN